MPISSKKIIECIHTLPKSFTKQELTSAIIMPKMERVKTRAKKKKPYRSNKDVHKIEKILNILTQAGLLRRTKKTFYKNSFIQEGIITLNTTGHGLCTTTGGDEILIRKDHLKNAHNNDVVSIEISDYKRGYLQGRVKKIVKREKRYYTAVITDITEKQYYCNLIDVPGETSLYSEKGNQQLEVNDFVIVEILDKVKGNRQRCKITGSFSLEDEASDLQRIRIKHNLPEDHGYYKELERIDEIVADEQKNPRDDFRDLFTITIDGEDAKDFDDAISIHKDKYYTLYVHIADVATFVKINTPLDQEALQRGTSYYLGDTVIPMLPEILSNEQCSLKEGVDRFCVTAVMKYDKKGNLIDHSFHNGIINVNKRLTYNLAEKLIQKNDKDDVSNCLRDIKDLTELLKSKRMKEGRLDLNLTDEKLVMESGKVKEIVFVERLSSHMMIEECMLSANIIVSRELKNQNIPTLYRIHEDVSYESMKKLQQFLQYLHIKLPLSGKSGINLQKVLDSVAGKEFEHVVNLVVLKSLMQAYYGVSPIGHFGLGFPDYTHFTSPIRRYPDLVVHRCLKSLIAKSPSPYSVAKLEEMGLKSSEKERIAQKAERGLIKLKACRLMKDRVGEKFEGLISGIAKFGFFVTLIDIPIEGMVPLRELTDDYYLVLEDEYTVIGRKFSKRFRLGDHITVVLSSVEIDTMRIDFKIP